jgi:hypothetical protein
VVKVIAEIPQQDRVGAATWGPASLSEKPDKNPGLFNYGIHAAEILFALMGPGCIRVQANYQKDTDQVIGIWPDGRIGTLRGLRAGNQGFGLTVFGKKAVRSQVVGTGTIYRELLKQIVTFFQTGSQIAGRPSFGAWLSYGLGQENANLPSFVVPVVHARGLGQQPRGLLELAIGSEGHPERVEIGLHGEFLGSGAGRSGFGTRTTTACSLNTVARNVLAQWTVGHQPLAISCGAQAQ